MNDPIDNIKPFLAVAGALIALGMGWAELNARINAKAEAEEVQAIERELRVNRILLCRMPEIRPDSHCEGYR